MPNVKQKHLQKFAWFHAGFRIFAGPFVGLVLGWGMPISGQTVPAGPAAERHFSRQLQQSVHIRGSVAPLLPTLQRISQAHGIGIFLDRRLDPQHPLELRGPAQPLAELLQTIAREQGARVSLLAPVAYIGPAPTTDKLATLLELNREQVRQMNPVEQRKWQTVTPTAWPFLTEPRQLVMNWCQMRGVALQGTDQIPHDLWAAQQLPPLDLLQQLTIVLAGFDLCVLFEPNEQPRISPIPDRVVITRGYPWSDRQAARQANADSPFPDLSTERRDGQLWVTGSIEDHQRVVEWLRGPAGRRPQRMAPTQQRYTLTVKNQPRSRVLEALAEQLNLELTWDNLDEAVRSEVISFHVQNVSVQELLRAVLGDSGLGYRMDNRTLAIYRGRPTDFTNGSNPR